MMFPLHQASCAGLVVLASLFIGIGSNSCTTCQRVMEYSPAMKSDSLDQMPVINYGVFTNTVDDLMANLGSQDGIYTGDEEQGKVYDDKRRLYEDSLLQHYKNRQVHAKPVVVPLPYNQETTSVTVNDVRLLSLFRIPRDLNSWGWSGTWYEQVIVFWCEYTVGHSQRWGVGIVASELMRDTCQNNVMWHAIECSKQLVLKGYSQPPDKRTITQDLIQLACDRYHDSMKLFRDNDYSDSLMVWSRSSTWRWVTELH